MPPFTMPKPIIVAWSVPQAVRFAKQMGWSAPDSYIRVVGNPDVMRGLDTGGFIFLLPNWRNVEGWDAVEHAVAVAEQFGGALVFHTADWR